MDVLARGEDLPQHVLAGDVGEDAQLDLVVVGGEQAHARARRRSRRGPGRPISERIGMFWRFGLVLESRPVVVATWLKVVWMRPVSGSIRPGSASR